MFGYCRKKISQSYEELSSNTLASEKISTFEPKKYTSSPGSPISPITPINPEDNIFEYKSDDKEWIDTAPLDGRKDREKLVELISMSLELLTKKNYTNKLPSDRNEITSFHSREIPSMTITSYLKRLAEYINVSSSALLVMMSIVKRIVIPINPFTVHRLALTSLLLAHKQIDDQIYNNAMFANVGGIKTKELNQLERELLQALDHTLPMDAVSFDEVVQELFFGKIENYYSSEELTSAGYKKEPPDSRFMSMYHLFKTQNLPTEEKNISQSMTNIYSMIPGSLDPR
ncbi:MAG: cyclin [Gammaproteobacteria bacterium]